MKVKPAMFHDYDYHLFHDRQGYLADLGRSVRIWREFRKGFRRFRGLKRCVTFFGSARFPEDHRYCQLAYETAKVVGEAGFSVMTGGGPGIMAAANKGARDVGARSIGCTIKLPHEQATNPYMDMSVAFNHFFVRKTMLLKYSQAFIFFPGGFGTMDEVFEVATLMATNTICDFPVVAMGSAYWKELRPFMDKTMLSEGTISERDLRFMKITDDPHEALELIKVKCIGEPI